MEGLIAFGVIALILWLITKSNSGGGDDSWMDAGGGPPDQGCG